MSHKIDYSTLNCLPDSDVLEVTAGTLQLKVKHKCGTAHTYVIDFEVTDDRGIEHQLQEDLAMLIDMMNHQVHAGAVEVQGRVYCATEIDYAKTPNIDELPVVSAPVPVSVLPTSSSLSSTCAQPPLPDDTAEEQTDTETEEPVLSLKESNERLEQEDLPMYPDVRPEPKPKRGRRNKNERVERSPKASKGDGEGGEHDVRPTEGGDEDAAQGD